MKRHDFDPLSFVFGAVFVALSLMLWLQRFDITAPGLQWLAAGVLLALGATLLLTSKKRSGDRR